MTAVLYVGVVHKRPAKRAKTSHVRAAVEYSDYQISS